MRAACHGSTLTSVSIPLRKIIESVVIVEGQLWGDRLECGHILNEASDTYGRRHQPTRRRCWKCANEATS